MYSVAQYKVAPFSTPLIVSRYKPQLHNSIQLKTLAFFLSCFSMQIQYMPS